MSYLWLVLSKEPFHTIVSYLSRGRGEAHTDISSRSTGLGSDAIGKVSRDLCSPSTWFDVKIPKIFQKRAIYIDCWKKEDLIQNRMCPIHNTYYSTCFFVLTFKSSPIIIERAKGPD